MPSGALGEPLAKVGGKVGPDGNRVALPVLFVSGVEREASRVGVEVQLAPGTRKDLGYFWIGAQGSQEIVLCESAIDSMSCFQLDPQRICISTSGVRADPPWRDGLLARGYQLSCGFDADAPGDAAASHSSRAAVPLGASATFPK